MKKTNKNILSVLSAVAMAGVVTSALSTTAFAAVDAIVIKDVKTGKNLEYKMSDLLASQTEFYRNGSSALYENFNAALIAEGNVVAAYHDNKTGYVDQKMIMEAYTDAQRKEEVFTLDTFTEKAVAIDMTTVKRVVVGGEVVDQDAAIKVATVKAVAANKLEVTFSTAVDTTKATFAVNKGAFVNNVSKTTWNDAKTVATLEMASNLTKGEYVVTVSGLELTGTNNVAKVTVDTQKSSALELTSNKLVLASEVVSGNLIADNKAVSVGYKISDQYGIDVTKAKKSSITWNASQGTVDSSVAGVLKLTGTFAKDNVVVVTGIGTGDSAGIVLSQTLTVGDMGVVTDVVFGDVKSTDTKVTTVYTNNLPKFYIPVAMKDQYGNPIQNKVIAETDTIKLLGNIGATFNNDADGNLILELAPASNQQAGAATITLVGKHSAKQIGTTLQVNAIASVSEFSMEFPSTIVAGDATPVVIPFTAVDQYGNAVTDKATLQAMIANVSVAGITGLGSNDFNFVTDYKTSKTALQLNVKDAKEGKVYLTLIVGKNVYTPSFEMLEKADAVLVAGTTKFTTNIVKDAAAVTLKASNIKLNDQYGRTFDWANLGADYKVVLSSSSDAVLVGTELVNKDASVVVTPAKIGTSKITAVLQHDTGKIVDGKEVWEAVDGSTYTFNINVVEAKAVKTYTVAEIGTLFAAPGKSDYNGTVKVTGVLADGSAVTINKTVIRSVISTNENILVDAGTLAVSAKAGMAITDKDISGKVLVTIDDGNTTTLLEKDVIISGVAPVATTVEYSDDVENGIFYVEAADIATSATQFVISDQYGVDITESLKIDKKLTFVVTESSNAAVKDLDTLSLAKAGDTFIINLYTSNGKTSKLKVVVTDTIK
jgi:hypothetical protein